MKFISNQFNDGPIIKLNVNTLSSAQLKLFEINILPSHTNQLPSLSLELVDQCLYKEN